MKLDEAIEVLAHYNIEAMGNTLHVKGKEHDSGVPQVGGHTDRNGAWLSWGGEGELPNAVATAINTTPRLIEDLRKLAKLWRQHGYDPGTEQASIAERCAAALERHLKET